jgi:hypothetical protein
MLDATDPQNPYNNALDKFFNNNQNNINFARRAGMAEWINALALRQRKTRV